MLITNMFAAKHLGGGTDPNILSAVAAVTAGPAVSSLPPHAALAPSRALFHLSLCLSRLSVVSLLPVCCTVYREAGRQLEAGAKV
jgi:hypothetical protein